MNLRKTFSGVLAVLLMAAVGTLLIWLPGWIIDKYDRIKTLGAIWGTLYLVAVIAGAVLLLGSMAWTVWKLYGNSIRKKLAHRRRSKNPSELSDSQKAAEIDENLEQVARLKASGDDPKLTAELNPLLAELESKRQSRTLEIVAFGTISSGKSSLLNLLAGREMFATDVRGGTTVTRNEMPWTGMDRVLLVDTPGVGEVDGAEHVFIAAESARDADIVLLVLDGPLRESEFRLIQKLGEMEKRIIICLNKTDWYAEDDRDKLVGQIAGQTQGIVRVDEIIPVQAQRGSRMRHRVTTDGTMVAETVDVPPDISALASRMIDVVRADGKDLLMANVLLQSRGVLEKAKERVRAGLDERAWKIVEKYQWGAAGIAAVNPFPLVDLAAGVGVSTKMIIDLADVYQQKVDLQTASKWLGQMGKILVTVVGSQGASIAVASIVASLIKTVPVAGTLAGNALQGAIQALITRWIGSVFIEYFRDEMHATEGGLASLARRQWQTLTTLDELRKLVQTAREKMAAK